ncbi:MAG: glycosyltransferase family 25 protein [Alphaproteobacteria bacterium]|nr:glycosyltransferase family 25 protein [Alphaproteobacteria bacterium]
MTLLGSTIFINLDRDTARRTHMETECAKAGLTPIRLSAANGAALDEGLRPYFPHAGDRERSFLSPGETGCYASHLSICRRIVSGDLRAPVIVFEDDIELHEGFSALIEHVLQSLPADWDIVRLSNDTKQVAIPYAELANASQLVRYSTIPGSTGAQMWSRAGAEKFIAAEPRDLPIDQDLKRAWHWKLNTFGVLPAPVRRDIFDTSSIDAIGGDGHRSKAKRQARLRAHRRSEAGARFAHGVRTFGADRWIVAEILSALIALAPKRSRPGLLKRANGLFG